MTAFRRGGSILPGVGTHSTAPASLAEVSLSQAEAPLVLALDLGTSSARAVVFDARGRALAGSEARQSVAMHALPDGSVESGADALLDDLFTAVDACLAQSGPALAHIAGVAMSVLASTFMGVDAAGRPLTPLITYADTRPTPDVPVLCARIDEAAVYQRTGCRLHPSYWPVRFLWLARTAPQLLRSAAQWLSIGDYLALRLFGTAATSYSVASWTGLLNRFRLAWDAELLQALPIAPEQLPSLVDRDLPQRGLRPEFAARWPALNALPWYPAVGDGVCANLGSGCAGPGRVALTVCTSSAVRAVLPGAPEAVPPGLWCYRVDRQRSLLGGALSEGGNVFAWLQQTLAPGAANGLEADVRQAAPDGHGLTFLPLLAGERSPGWLGQARGALIGLSLATSPADLLQAGLEGVAYRLALVYSLLRPSLPAEPEIVASGGAVLHSPAWLKILADALGRPLTVSAVPEASARGAALLALEALSGPTSPATRPDFLGETYLPDPAHHLIYQAARQRQQALYRHLYLEDKP